MYFCSTELFETFIKMSYFGAKSLEKSWNAVKQTDQPTNQLALKTTNQPTNQPTRKLTNLTGFFFLISLYESCAFCVYMFYLYPNNQYRVTFNYRWKQTHIRTKLNLEIICDAVEFEMKKNIYLSEKEIRYVSGMRYFLNQSSEIQKKTTTFITLSSLHCLGAEILLFRSIIIVMIPMLKILPP